MMNWNLVLQVVGLILFALVVMRFCGGMGGGCGMGKGSHRHDGGLMKDGIKPDNQNEAVGGGEAKYYCPMHPEITSNDANATCPKCGGMPLQRRPAGKARA